MGWHKIKHVMESIVKRTMRATPTNWSTGKFAGPGNTRTGMVKGQRTLVHLLGIRLLGRLLGLLFGLFLLGLRLLGLRLLDLFLVGGLLKIHRLHWRCDLLLRHDQPQQ